MYHTFVPMHSYKRATEIWRLLIYDNATAAARSCSCRYWPRTLITLTAQASHTYEYCASGGQMQVIPDVFAVHAPHSDATVQTTAKDWDEAADRPVVT